MKRIDTINARENMFGVGKSGFHDNADLPGQDATYVSPEWFNTVQEELCNLLELRGITLDPTSKRQLYDLLTTQADLEALADEIETNFIRKSQIVDNLTTNDATKVASARQVKILQDNKLDKSALNNTLTSTSTTQAATAAQVKVLNDRLVGGGRKWNNVKANRLLNTTYWNPGPDKLEVALSLKSTASSDNTTVYVGDYEVYSKIDVGIELYWIVPIFFTVNPGESYKVTSTYQANYDLIERWSER